MSIELLTDNHRESVLNALGESQQRIYIITPFIKKQPAHRLAQIIQKNKVDCVLISRFNYENFATGVSDIDALIELHQAGAKVLALKNLHTKLYLIDDCIVILGSANFTNGGLQGNHELSLIATDESQLFQKCDEYFADMRAAIEADHKGIVTGEWLHTVKKRVQQLCKDKKKNATTIDKTGDLGAELPHKAIVEENDTVQDFLQSKLKKKTQNRCWIKFSASSAQRKPNKPNQIQPYAFDYNKEGQCATYFSEKHKPRKIQEGDKIFLALHSWDQNGKACPIIVAQAFCHEFKEENKLDEDCQWPYFIELYNEQALPEVSKTIQYGVPLYEVVEALGTDMYASSQGTNKPLETLLHSHRQQAYLELTDKARKYLESKFRE